MKTTYEERAIKFIERTLAPLLAQNKPRYPKRAIRNYNREHPDHPLKMTSGYTRTVIIRSDYVVKIDHNPNSGFGNNESEVKAYEFAKNAGYEYLFAKPTLFRVKGLKVNFEIMPRVRNGIGNFHKHYSRYLTHDELYFVNSFFGDLHEGNLGYFKNKPIFIDYADIFDEAFE